MTREASEETDPRRLELVLSRRQGRIYHLGGTAAFLRDMALKALPSEQWLARYDWLYGVKK